MQALRYQIERVSLSVQSSPKILTLKTYKLLCLGCDSHACPSKTLISHWLILLPNFSCLANYKGKLFDLFLDWSATFLTERDRLLRDDFPRPEQYRSMSEGESQEKMVLWKLRCSARRQKTSSTGNMMDTRGIFLFQL